MNAHTAKGRNEGEKIRSALMNWIVFFSLSFSSANRPVYLFVKLSEIESLRLSERMREWKEKKRRKQLESIEWIQGWLFFLTYSHIHSVCQYDLIFQTTQSNFKVIFVIFTFRNGSESHACTPTKSISAWFDAFFGFNKVIYLNNQNTNISAENKTPTEYDIVLEATMKDRDADIRCSKTHTPNK